MRLLAGERIASNLLQQPFTYADAWNGDGTQVQIAPDHDEDDRSDAHYVGAIATHGVGLHALTHVALEDSRQAFAKQGELQRRYAVLAGAWSDCSQGFRAA